MKKIFANKLHAGDEIRVIAPARSLSIIGESNITLARARLEKNGYKVTFGKHCYERDLFLSSSVKSRLSDLHAAFADKKVKAMLTAIGGFNSNQLLPHIDYELLKKNPKILCGYSDITALANGIYAKTGLVTYSGPHFSTFAMQKEFAYNQEYFDKCLVANEPYEVTASKTFTDDAWYREQDRRDVQPTSGYWIINKGVGIASGTIIGGNITIFSLLFGTQYMPSLKNTIVFLEDDETYKGDSAVLFDDKLNSLMQQPGADGIKGIVIGRFQHKSEMTKEKIDFMYQSLPQLRNIPVIANVDFGHTNPLFTFPIGGTAELKVTNKSAQLKIINH